MLSGSKSVERLAAMLRGGLGIVLTPYSVSGATSRDAYCTTAGLFWSMWVFGRSGRAVTRNEREPILGRTGVSLTFVDSQ